MKIRDEDVTRRFKTKMNEHEEEKRYKIPPSSKRVTTQNTPDEYPIDRYVVTRYNAMPIQPIGVVVICGWMDDRHYLPTYLPTHPLTYSTPTNK